MKIQSISIFYQTDEETGGNAGWAYNAIDSNGGHASDGFQVRDEGDDDGSESFSDVREAFALAWPEAHAQFSRLNWQPRPEGGWRVGR